MKVDLPIPHFTTIATRTRGLRSSFRRLSNQRPTDLVIDSSGFKIYGEGEWTVRQRGKQKRRRWKKFHIGICLQTHEIIVAEVATLEKADCEIGRCLCKEPRSVQKVIGDGAYDTLVCYKTAYEKKARLLVPPRQGAVVSDGTTAWVGQRDEAICQIIGLGNTEEAIKLWKKLTGYHQRFLVETAFSRFKGIFGSSLFSKSVDNQEVELLVKAYVMNEMTKIGMPREVMI